MRRTLGKSCFIAYVRASDLTKIFGGDCKKTCLHDCVNCMCFFQHHVHSSVGKCSLLRKIGLLVTPRTIMCLSLGHLKIINFPFVPNGK